MYDIDAHRALNLKPGDKVIVTHSVSKKEAKEKGWGFLWCNEKDKFIGKVSTVTHDDDSSYGFVLVYQNIPWYFPYFCIRKLTPEEKPKKIPVKIGEETIIISEPIARLLSCPTT